MGTAASILSRSSYGRDASKSIRTITAIFNDVSAKVRAQYEVNPYPRWLSVDKRPPRTLEAHLSHVLPKISIGGIPSTPPRILIAGCGTGRHAIQTALRFQDCEVIGLDLSRTSLAYAKRMAQRLDIANVKFLQGDILALGALADRFDVIESSGVLHHLADPMAGWRVLKDLLVPGGFMRLAFYSRRARAPFDDVRARVPNNLSIVEQIRAARAAVYGLPEDHPARALLKTADFYALSGVRDALLHEQETGVDPLWIKSALDDLSLQFLGFELPDPNYLQAYAKYRPDDPAGLDLTGWVDFEADHPFGFLGMYQFWARSGA